MNTQRFRRSWLLVAGLAVSAVAQAQPEVAEKPVRYDSLALILALLALIGLILLWWQTRLGWEKINTERRKGASGTDELRELANRVSRSENENRKLANQLKALESELGQLRDKLATRQERPPVASPDASASTQTAPPRQAVPTPSPATDRTGVATHRSPSGGQSQRPAAAKPLPKKLYARTVDVPGGFSVNSLLEVPNRPMVFVITTTGPGEATFRVTDDPEAQRLALSDPYSYLSDACNYQSRPEANSRIHMVADGKLQLQGEKWHIIEKAEISFYA